MKAVWVSKGETVEVCRTTQNRFRMFAEVQFVVRCENGSIECIDRRDIITETEIALVEELARILDTKKNPHSSSRYSEIIRTLMKDGVPWIDTLKKKREPKTEQIFLI